jgi:transposase InsO family protein/transposase-like protein
LALVKGYYRSGHSMARFSDEHGISKATLYKWCKRYKEGGARGLETRVNPGNAIGNTHGAYPSAQRRQIVEAYLSSGMSLRAFCQVWKVAVATLATWHRRYQAQGAAGLESRPSGRKTGSVSTIPESVREEVVRVKRRFPEFGLQKLRDYLRRFFAISISTGTIAKTLRTADPPIPPVKPKKRPRRKPAAVRHFERAHPGDLWQSDITSLVLARRSQRVYLTVFLDDCSRYVVSFGLHLHQHQEIVTEALMEGIAKFGKPKEVLTDQGRQYFAWRGRSEFQKLLAHQSIQHVVARSHHPQTVGKCERLWKTVDEELWQRVQPAELDEARTRLTHFFAHYNHFRPHQGIEGLVPADRFFGAESAVRRTLEAALAKNELAIALREEVRKPVYLSAQVGDRQLSLHGERGRLVIQTPEGSCQEIRLEELGIARGAVSPATPRADEVNDHGAQEPRESECARERQDPLDKSFDDSLDSDADGASRGGEAPPHEDVAQAPALSQVAGAGAAGAGAVGSGERGGAAAGAPGVHRDPGVLAREVEARGGGVEAGDVKAASVATLAAGARGDGGGPLEAAPLAAASSPAGLDGSGERPEDAAQEADGSGAPVPDARGAGDAAAGAAGEPGDGEGEGA